MSSVCFLKEERVAESPDVLRESVPDVGTEV